MNLHTTPHGTTLLVPPGLCDRGEAMFLFLAEMLDKDRRLRGGDFMALGQLCQLQIDIANLQDSLRRTGLTEETDKGQTQRRVEVSTLNQMRGHFRSLLAQFGLTPKSKRGLAAGNAINVPVERRAVERSGGQVWGPVTRPGLSVLSLHNCPVQVQKFR